MVTISLTLLDVQKPKLVFFFDEAHLLFHDAPKSLLEKIEQVVRLIRSKGVGIYFVTQNPLDIPDSVLGQLGNRVQHALRAFTPRDQKAVKAAAQTMRANPKLGTEKVISELSTGEALISMLDKKGRPAIVERAFILPPASKMGPLSDEERKRIIKSSVIFGHYEEAIDRKSAHEIIKRRIKSEEDNTQTLPTDKAQQDSGGDGGMIDMFGDLLLDKTGPRGGNRPGILSAAAKSAARSIGSQVGRALFRGILGNILGGKGR